MSTSPPLGVCSQSMTFCGFQHRQFRHRRLHCSNRCLVGTLRVLFVRRVTYSTGTPPMQHLSQSLTLVALLVCCSPRIYIPGIALHLLGGYSVCIVMLPNRMTDPLDTQAAYPSSRAPIQRDGNRHSPRKLPRQPCQRSNMPSCSAFKHACLGQMHVLFNVFDLSAFPSRVGMVSLANILVFFRWSDCPQNQDRLRYLIWCGLPTLCESHGQAKLTPLIPGFTESLLLCPYTAFPSSPHVIFHERLVP